MAEDKIVQFVCFETSLTSERFITHWEQYNRSENCDADVTLQQTEKNGAFRYVAQHRYTASEFQFYFTKAKRSFRTPEVETRVRQAGGYSILQSERKNDVHADESKVFAFVVHAPIDLTVYRQLSAHSKLNIYEAYFENCQYAYILEFFVKAKYEPLLLEQLRLNHLNDVAVYRECVLQPL